MRSKFVLALFISAMGASALAKLPPPGDDVKAKAAQSAAKAAWTGKVGAYKLCQAMDRVAQKYRSGAASSAAVAEPLQSTPPCADPGAYVAAAPAKQLESAEAHSQPGMATVPPVAQAASDASGEGKASASKSPMSPTTSVEAPATGATATATPDKAPAEKKLEAAGAHSPPSMATTPPAATEASSGTTK